MRGPVGDFSPRKTQKEPFFDAAFYPYSTPDVDPVFAVTGGRETLICRLRKGASNPFEVVSWLRDADENADLNSCTWTRDVESGHPLICVAGTRATIRITDVVTGKPVKPSNQTLVGHGGGINDIAISPISPLILASASEDHSIRLWTLDGRYEKQPCALICAGEGHKETVLTVAFHATGRYLLSGGQDCIVNLWVIPEIPNEHTGTDKPTVLHYPHFSTSAVHSDYVDCVTFHHDLILSKCAREDKIVLWRIEGFSSSAPPPSPDQAPTTHESRETRSAFGVGYQRLLQFEIPRMDPFYMRFGFFAQPGKHPVLAMGNTNSKVFLWDFKQLEDWSDGNETAFWKVPLQRKGSKASSANRESSIASTTSSSVLAAGPTHGEASATGRHVSKKHDIADPFGLVQAHKTITVPDMAFCARRAAWSVSGDWLIVVGDHRVISIFERWGGDPG
ncbi:MAG: hypothetical protein M1817_006248 [Caeruleum heppii]|nr:MAG: hypothetical protein M1817_006248 [Caeruleum heppii]